MQMYKDNVQRTCRDIVLLNIFCVQLFVLLLVVNRPVIIILVTNVTIIISCPTRSQNGFQIPNTVVD